MNKKLIFAIALAVFCMTNGLAQEYVTGFNGFITEEKSQNMRVETVATLPFFDDFTNKGAYPDPAKWQSKDVLVNAGFPYMPVNYRAATFDVVDQYGKVYSRGSANPFIADTLLSVKIRLDSLDNQKLAVKDSLYFSFYYQAGGFGDAPEVHDSLVLKFGYGYDEEVFDSVNGYNVIVRRTAWRQMWAKEGYDFDSTFHKVMIPIVDTCFFVEDFYLLFYNYGTLPTTMYPNDRSNMDEWNIDMLYLDKDRSVINDSYPLVSFSHTAPSFLSRYQSMPYKHFKENPIEAINNDFKMYLTNLDTVVHSVKYSCEVKDNNTEWSYQSIKYPTNVSPYSDNGVNNIHVPMNDFIYPYNSALDTTSFTISHYAEVVDNDAVIGDTVIRKQGFYNYFAYDDGIPEMGYGLVPDDTYFATQFNVARLDTISGVQMLFNRTFNDANLNFFDIVVWRDNNGKPGQILYVLEDQRPKWHDSLMYRFSYYVFDEVVKVNSVFYVGIRQQSKKTINIGFDTSNDNQQYNFYDVGEGWKQSEYHGSLMIRPVMGKSPYFIGVGENQGLANGISVYPNPAQNVVRIDALDENMCSEILIYDLTGREVKHSLYCNELNVSELQNGAYMIRVIMQDGSYETSKLLISK